MVVCRVFFSDNLRPLVLTSAHMATFSVPIGTKQPLNAAPRDGAMIKFNASTTFLQPDPNAKIDNSSLNLVSDNNDILLSIAFRRVSHSVVLNSHSASGGWGIEEYFNFNGSFTEGHPSNVSVTLRGKVYLIFIEGSLRYTYARRIDAPIMGVSYIKDDDMTGAIFGDSIDAKVINSLPPPNPRQSLRLSIRQKKTLDGPVAQNDLVYYNSSTTSLTPDPPPASDNTWLHLLSAAGHILLTVSTRRAESTIVFKARGTDGKWTPDETISLNGLFHEGDPTSVVVFNGASTFDIYIAGAYHYEFTKKFDKEVTAVEYGKGSGMSTQIFADTIDVAVANT